MMNERRREERVSPPSRDEWPVRHDGDLPSVNLAEWRFKVWGQVEEEVEWTWEEFERFRREERVADLDCADGWSLTGKRWTGVPTREILSRVRLKPDAAFVIVHGEGGYRANLSLYAFASPDALFAHDCDGRSLTTEHGWPLRLIVAGQRAWKAVKWVRGLEFLIKDWPGTREMEEGACAPPPGDV
jgi:DMSO/TMAO reductase YedYZ molybdopterin-dependent catalytic subunit